MLPLSRLFVVGRGSPEYSESDRVSTFYAESWALVHYLAFGTGGPTGQLSQLNQLVGLLKAGAAPKDAHQQVFGDPAALRRAFEHYVSQQSFRYRRRDVALLSSGDSWTSRTLTAPEALTLRAGFHAATGRAIRSPRTRGGGTRSRSKYGRGPRGAGRRRDAGRLSPTRRCRASRVRSSSPGVSDYGQFLFGRLLWQKAQDEASLETAERAFTRAVEIERLLRGGLRRARQRDVRARGAARAVSAARGRAPRSSSQASSSTASRPSGWRRAAVASTRPGRRRNCCSREPPPKTGQSSMRCSRS